MFQEHAPVHGVTSSATRTTSPAVRFSTSLFVFYSVSGIKSAHPVYKVHAPCFTFPNATGAFTRVNTLPGKRLSNAPVQMCIQSDQALKLYAWRFSDGFLQRQAAHADPAHGSRRAGKRGLSDQIHRNSTH